VSLIPTPRYSELHKFPEPNLNGRPSATRPHSELTRGINLLWNTRETRVKLRDPEVSGIDCMQGQTGKGGMG
jgi:hypothetical protein